MTTAHQGDEALVRQAGRALLVAIHGAQRALKLYPLENAAVQRALDDLLASSQAMLQFEGVVEVRLTGDFIFINETRLRLGLDNFAAFSGFVGLLRGAGVGLLRIEDGVARREWQAFLSAIGALPTDPLPEARFELLRTRLQESDVVRIEVGLSGDRDDEEKPGDEALERAKRTYAHGVTVTRDVVQGVRMGRAPNTRRLKRAVQLIVDQILENELSITGLTTLRDFDEYTFTHSVNVCIFSVALGRRLGLDRLQLYDLGLAALMHDIGKARIDVDVINKATALDDQEWRRMQAHPWLGTMTLFRMREGEDLPYRAILAAHEHHMKIDLSGYPRPIRPRRLGFFSRLVAVADGYDAATTRRSYQALPWEPSEVLREMWLNPGRGYDPVLVKALINLLGIYPVGTVVILDSFEVAIVAGPGSDPGELHRPVVRLAVDPAGARIPPPGQLVDLSVARPDGSYQRSIVKVTSPDRYGLVVGDFFV
ncbi:MAG: HD domain-containing protein [Gemmatimonadales bacterium]|jgi:HD-GYP domain-containing protein (c-di-GMP phosphodiesterase class II)|nr:HD domain-containing protein [Gemmatimonadales bacterium]MDZ4257561.1 HD domain-containing protein [Gemmatimonadales bacterium]MDZ4389073.1 HD domain-containing protein [Gemmatimonadales bacterium]